MNVCEQGANTIGGHECVVQIFEQCYWILPAYRRARASLDWPQLTSPGNLAMLTPVRSESKQIVRVSHWIGGAQAPGEGDRHADVFNPATGEVAAQVALGTANDVALAAAAAKAAFSSWSETAPLK